MRRALYAGVTYVAIVFAAGFALGVIRTVLLEAALGALLAVAIELPVILAIAWIVCRWSIRHFDVPDRFLPRAVMGAAAFVLLMLAEVAMSLALADRSLAHHIQLYREPSHLLGLAGQTAFALFPLLHAWTTRKKGKGDH